MSFQCFWTFILLFICTSFVYQRTECYTKKHGSQLLCTHLRIQDYKKVKFSRQVFSSYPSFLLFTKKHFNSHNKQNCVRKRIRSQAAFMKHSKIDLKFLMSKSNSTRHKQPIRTSKVEKISTNDRILLLTKYKAI